jgi:periplasmic mercuric ion binding protein
MSVISMAQSNKEKIVIKTSAVCDMCKTTIEEAVYKVDGVKSVYLDLETKEASVKYDGTLVSKEVIMQAITLAGYDANELMADEKAYENLNACCKKDAVH